jgi:transglutaminase-like putative cysteine protease
MMTAKALGLQDKTNEAPPTGASAAWTSEDPILVQARDLLARGRLAEAEELLGDGKATQRAEMRQIIDRFRREYSLDESGFLAKLRRSVPDVTPADLRRWREAGQLQHRVIDGRVMYFRREPSNLFRFCPEAISRRAPQEPKPSSWKLVDHLAKVIAEAETSGKTEVVPIKHRITYTLTIPQLPSDIAMNESGSMLRVWLPFAQEYRQQKDVKLVSTSPAAKLVAENGSPHRTIFFEVPLKTRDAREFQAVFEYASCAYYPMLSASLAKPLPADWGDQYLGERPPHIVFTPELRQTVKQIIDDEINPLARARKIFHWVASNVRYCAEEEYCLIPSFSTKALNSLKGDCGIQSTLFITMCRAAGIPARWQSGWETKPVDWNMHDWAEFYVEPWGWLPADVSYGLQKSDDPKVREFYFGHQDSYRLITNLDYGRELVPPKNSLRSEPADFQRGEVEIDGRNLYFDEWDYDLNFEQS